MIKYKKGDIVYFCSTFTNEAIKVSERVVTSVSQKKGAAYVVKKDKWTWINRKKRKREKDDWGLTLDKDVIQAARSVFRIDTGFYTKSKAEAIKAAVRWQKRKVKKIEKWIKRAEKELLK